MTAESVTGIGPGSAEGPLRGYDLDNIRKVYINQSGNLLPCITILGPVYPGGGAEKYVLRAVGDGQVKVDSTDQVPGYLLDKLIPGTNITFDISTGPDQTITINSSSIPGGLPPVIVGAATYACLSGTAVGDAVYVSAGDTVLEANASTTSTAPAFGFIYSKPSSTTCLIAYAGEIHGFVGLTPGLPYYLDTVNGGISTTAPSGSGNVVQPVGFARNTTTLVANLQNYVVL